MACYSTFGDSQRLKMQWWPCMRCHDHDGGCTALAEKELHGVGACKQCASNYEWRLKSLIIDARVFLHNK